MRLVHNVGVGSLLWTSILAGAIKTLPDGPLIMGYQNWDSCDPAQTINAVEKGVNVVIWFATSLELRPVWKQRKNPVVSSGLNYTCVAEVRQEIEKRGLTTSHLISIGGFDRPHPDTSYSGQSWFEVWRDWNALLPRPFDGFDWDLEGNGHADSVYNAFTAEVLNVVVDMSVAAKADGFIVTMVPPQSFLDHTTSSFNFSLTLAYPDWHPEFKGHGQNCYAYLLAAAPEGTFDVVTVQLYESWSRADQALLQQNVLPAQYLQHLVANFSEGWDVDFGILEGLRVQGTYKVHVEPTRLVIGLSHGSQDGKSAFFWPESLQEAYINATLHPRGYAFWHIGNEGLVANGTSRKLELASGLDQFLHVRNKTTETVSGDESADGGMIIEHSARLVRLERLRPHSYE